MPGTAENTMGFPTHFHANGRHHKAISTYMFSMPNTSTV